MVNLRLKQELLKQNISQIALAHRLGIDDGYLSNVVRGWKKPPEDLKFRISIMLGKDPAWLFPKCKTARRTAVTSSVDRSTSPTRLRRDHNGTPRPSSR